MSAEPELPTFDVRVSLGTLDAQVEAINADEASTAAILQLSEEATEWLCAATFEVREVET